MAKNNRISTRKDTSTRRKSMLVKVLSFNISNNHLSINKKHYLKELFKEAKFYYNFLISWSQKTIVDDFGNLLYPHNLNKFDTKINIISVFNSSTQTHFDYEILHLSSQIKQNKIKFIF